MPSRRIAHASGMRSSRTSAWPALEERRDVRLRGGACDEVAQHLDARRVVAGAGVFHRQAVAQERVVRVFGQHRLDLGHPRSSSHRTLTTPLRRRGPNWWDYLKLSSRSSPYAADKTRTTARTTGPVGTRARDGQPRHPVRARASGAGAPLAKRIRDVPPLAAMQRFAFAVRTSSVPSRRNPPLARGPHAFGRHL